MEGLPNTNRRDFIGKSLKALGLISLAGLPSVLSATGWKQLTILHTNDTHSRIDPFPDNDPKYAGEGGFARRAAMIESIRKTDENVLLLDAGDIFQGTPYFNFYHGELEYKLMSLMQYDATTFGNHDFDLGCGNILTQMKHADFDFINCNYDFKNTELEKNKKIFPYRIYKKGGLKIGVLGVGIALQNLVDKKFVGNIVYNDPIKEANKISSVLRNDEKCDYIICLSHLGFKYDSDKVSDIILAASSSNIDLIIGGHTHTFLEKPYSTVNAQGREVLITQVGWAGIWLGKTEIYFSHRRKNFFHNSSHHRV